jgi:hypothetical protein
MRHLELAGMRLCGVKPAARSTASVRDSWIAMTKKPCLVREDKYMSNGAMNSIQGREMLPLNPNSKPNEERAKEREQDQLEPRIAYMERKHSEKQQEYGFYCANHTTTRKESIRDMHRTECGNQSQRDERPSQQRRRRIGRCCIRQDHDQAPHHAITPSKDKIRAPANHAPFLMCSFTVRFKNCHLSMDAKTERA